MIRGQIGWFFTDKTALSHTFWYCTGLLMILTLFGAPENQHL
jgi:hypothetical protein